jgi:hypothetical protein
MSKHRDLPDRKRQDCAFYTSAHCSHKDAPHPGHSWCIGTAYCAEPITPRPPETMKVYASCKGDPSVGIAPDQAELIMPARFVPSPSNDTHWQESRRWLRTQLRELFNALFDEEATISFQDECPECGHLQADCTCICINCSQPIAQCKCGHRETP